jgi:crossover junction endodeoxyribonuclease RuvC
MKPIVAQTETILLGIDPGTMVMGYGLIKIVGSAQPTLLAYDAVVMRTLPNQVMKLKHIFETVLGLIDTYHPDEMAIEAPFFGKNVQSMLKLGRAQGVAMAAAMAREVPVVEYMPKLVKRSVTGNGNASKEQVAAMLGSLLALDKLDKSLSPKLLDATDGLAVAMCHYFQTSGAVIKTTRTSKSATGKGARGWAAFMAENPERVSEGKS